MSEFCNGDKYLPLKFSVYSYTNFGDHPLYGSVVCNMKDIEMAKDGTLEIFDKKGKLGGYIKFNQLQMDMRSSLVDYLKMGWKLDVSIAIDFTLSNREITDFRSLHKLNQGEMNQYEKAIFEVCNVMTPYAKNE